MLRRHFLSTAAAAPLAAAPGAALPLRGLHLAAPRPGEMESSLRFIEEALPKEGVNTLFLEFNYRFRNTRFPSVVDEPALSADQVRSLAGAARNAGLKLIPQVNLLGHQSWAKNTFALLREFPEFDETPGLYPGNEGIYCRSYCPRHPRVHEVVLPICDEICELTGAQDFHAGMDEVFLLGEDTCPRCKGAGKAELFAAEVHAIRDHLTRSQPPGRGGFGTPMPDEFVHPWNGGVVPCRHAPDAARLRCCRFRRGTKGIDFPVVSPAILVYRA